MKKVFFIPLLLSLLGPPLRADNPLTALLERSPYTAEERLRVTAVFTRAGKEEVPAAMLLPRLEEGLAKRVPAAALVPVLARELDTLVRAGKVLKDIDARFDTVRFTAVWQRAALCLTNGMDEGAVRAIGRAAVTRWPDFREATDLYLALVRWGLVKDAALSVTAAALASRLEGRDFAGVVSLFARGRALYLSPQAVADRLVDAFPSAADLESLAARVLY